MTHYAAMTKSPQRRPGRPSKPDHERAGVISVRFPPPLLDALDEIVAARLDGADRSAVIREFVADGVQRQQKRKGL